MTWSLNTWGDESSIPTGLWTNYWKMQELKILLEKEVCDCNPSRNEKESKEDIRQNAGRVCGEGLVFDFGSLCAASNPNERTIHTTKRMKRDHGQEHISRDGCDIFRNTFL